jgi:hypothetical protein
MLCLGESVRDGEQRDGLEILDGSSPLGPLGSPLKREAAANTPGLGHELDYHDRLAAGKAAEQGHGFTPCAVGVSVECRPYILVPPSWALFAGRSPFCGSPLVNRPDTPKKF